jgi:hypothetical protein
MFVCLYVWCAVWVWVGCRGGLCWMVAWCLVLGAWSTSSRDRWVRFGGRFRPKVSNHWHRLFGLFPNPRKVSPPLTECGEFREGQPRKTRTFKRSMLSIENTLFDPVPRPDVDGEGTLHGVARNSWLSGRLLFLKVFWSATFFMHGCTEEPMQNTLSLLHKLIHHSYRITQAHINVTSYSIASRLD